MIHTCTFIKYSTENYLAVGFYFSGLIHLFNLKTGKGEMDPIAFKDHVDDLNTHEVFPSGRIKIKIWRTGTIKILLQYLLYIFFYINPH